VKKAEYKILTGFANGKFEGRINELAKSGYEVDKALQLNQLLCVIMRREKPEKTAEEILGEAYENGVWSVVGDRSAGEAVRILHSGDQRLTEDGMGIVALYDEADGRGFEAEHRLPEYGVTWALTKEELE